jgi:uncharacterized protein (DUF1501 family)
MTNSTRTRSGVALTRREFMVGCSAAIAAMAGARISQIALAQQPGPAAGDTIITVFLRGGMDGLNTVLPIDGPDRGFYEAARPSLKVPVTDGGRGAAIGLANGTLDGTPFGLHPGLAPLNDLYTENALAVVHAAGLTSATRSHFDAMHYMESATPDTRRTENGWMTRYLATQQVGAPGTIPAMSMGATTARALIGRDDAITVAGSGGLSIGGEGYGAQITAMRRNALRRMYAGEAWLQRAGSNALNAIDSIEGALGAYTPAAGAAYVANNAFSGQLMTLAQIIKRDMGLRAATVDLGGWDTHENQQFPGADPRGYFFNHLNAMARSLLAFYTDLKATGHHLKTTVVVMSEFGRRVRENNNVGTDHGHGNVMFVLGGNVNGGRMYGKWPGLSNDALFERADLAITTDYRTVVAEILQKRAGVADVAPVLPGFAFPGALGIVK